MLQLFRESGRPECSVPTNVDAAQKNDVAHMCGITPAIRGRRSEPFRLDC
jgi:hypothetical protein